MVAQVAKELRGSISLNFTVLHALAGGSSIPTQFYAGGGTDFISHVSRPYPSMKAVPAGVSAVWLTTDGSAIADPSNVSFEPSAAQFGPEPNHPCLLHLGDFPTALDMPIFSVSGSLPGSLDTPVPGDGSLGVLVPKFKAMGSKMVMKPIRPGTWAVPLPTESRPNPSQVTAQVDFTRLGNSSEFRDLALDAITGLNASYITDSQEKVERWYGGTPPTVVDVMKPVSYSLTKTHVTKLMTLYIIYDTVTNVTTLEPSAASATDVKASAINAAAAYDTKMQGLVAHLAAGNPASSYDPAKLAELQTRPPATVPESATSFGDPLSTQIETWWSTRQKALSGVVAAPVPTGLHAAYQAAVASGYAGTEAQWLAAYAADHPATSQPSDPVAASSWLSGLWAGAKDVGGGAVDLMKSWGPLGTLAFGTGAAGIVTGKTNYLLYAGLAVAALVLIR